MEAGSTSSDIDDDLLVPLDNADYTPWGDGGDHRSAVDAAETATPAAHPVGRGVDGPVVRHLQPYWDEAMLEEVAGVLVLEGDCLWLDRPEWQQRLPVVWPSGTLWDGENRAVVTPAGETLRIGQSVIGGGGYTDSGSVASFAGTEARRLVERCLDGSGDQVAIVNNQLNAITATGT